MKHIIETTERHDAALAALAVEANIGMGSKEPDSLETFVPTLLLQYLDKLTDDVEENYKRRVMERVNTMSIDELRQAVERSGVQT